MRTRSKVLGIAAVIFALSLGAWALATFLGGVSGTTTPAVTEGNIHLTLDDVYDTNFSGDDKCLEGSVLANGQTIELTWSPAVDTLDGVPQAAPEECWLWADYDQDAGDTETAVFLGFVAPSGVSVRPNSIGTCGQQVVNGDTANEFGAELYFDLAAGDDPTQPITFDPSIHGFSFMDETTFDGSQCEAGW